MPPYFLTDELLAVFFVVADVRSRSEQLTWIELNFWEADFTDSPVCAATCLQKAFRILVG